MLSIRASAACTRGSFSSANSKPFFTGFDGMRQGYLGFTVLSLVSRSRLERRE
jgi:hypothetical protein